MKLQLAFFPLSLAVACGGNVFKDQGSSGDAGSGALAGSSSAGGSGGGVGTAGTLSLGGEPSCATVRCATIDCNEDEVAVLQPGGCCTTCEPKVGGCEDVKCEPVERCNEGYELTQPPGACCVGCVPKSGGVSCQEIACPETACPLGYVRGDLLGGCCYDCVPDPLYCRARSDCVIADKPRACCGCPEAITLRQYQAEPCWSEVGSERAIPQSCYPQATCDAVCAPCLSERGVECSEHRCISRGFGLK